MPLVFIHGVANRPSKEQAAMIAQRNKLFSLLVFEREDVKILNPDWGSFAVTFGEDLPWLPSAEDDEAFAAEDDGFAAENPEQLDGKLHLGEIAARDAEQAIDLVAMAALDAAIRDAADLGLPEAAATGEAVELAKASAAYLTREAAFREERRVAVPALAAGDNVGFADALEAEIDRAVPETEGYGSGIGDTIRGAIGKLTRIVGNGASDFVLKRVRADASRGVSLFLGDIFVYLRGRDEAGANGTRQRIFKPIIDALIAGAREPRADGEPFVVVAHSLGGVILYDILTDAQAQVELEAGIGCPIEIDALFTVGSQPGFFADLGMYPGGRPSMGTKLPMPPGVARWMNVFDFTDVFSFRCEFIFEGVRDFGYDTVTDVRYAHGAYFLRPSFYKRMRARLAEPRPA